MRILIITQHWYPDTFGGSENVAAEQAHRLAERGHQVTVLTEYIQDYQPPEENMPITRGGGSLRLIRYGRPEQFKKWGASLTDMKMVPPLVRQLYKEHKFEVAIVHHCYSAYGFFKANLKIPTLYVFHASTAREAEVEGLRRQFHGLMLLLRPFLIKIFIWFTRRVERYVLRQANRIAVFSDFSESILQETYAQPKDKVLKIKSGIDMATFAPPTDKRAAKEKLGFSSDRPIILTVRRLTARMGLLELLYASLQVREYFPDAKILIIGEGPMREDIINEIGQLGLRGYTTLVGKVPLKELPLYYQAADLFILPTAAFEGLGMATLEALASGLPVVGSPIGATPEILNKIDASLVTKSAKADDLAEGMISYLSRIEADKAALAQKCRAVAERDYNWEKAIGELESLIKNVNIKV